MKNLICVMLIASISLYGCDKCKDVNCNHGECNKGDCICNDFYEGDFCDIEMREKFYGRYYGTLKFEDGTSEQVLTQLRKAGEEVSKIDWYNFGYLLLTGSTEFTIPEQVVTYDGEIYVLRGEGGNLEHDKLTINYSIGYQGVTLYYQFVGYPYLGKQSAKGSIENISLFDNLKSAKKP